MRHTLCEEHKLREEHTLYEEHTLREDHMLCDLAGKAPILLETTDLLFLHPPQSIQSIGTGCVAGSSSKTVRRSN